MTPTLPMNPPERQPRILLLAPFFYGAASAHGGGALCYAQLGQLAQFATLAFLGFRSAEPGSDAADAACLARHCEIVSSVPLRMGKAAVFGARLRSLMLRGPELATLCRTPAMVQALHDTLERFRPDLVWIQFPQMAHYAELCGAVPCVMDVQDAYSLSGFRQAQRLRGLRGLRAWLDWVCWARYEARHYSRFAAALTLSEQDAQVLRALNPATHTVAIGLPLAHTEPAAAVASFAATTPVEGRVGFVGSFGHRPNLEALGWFLQQVWPQVRAQLPAARFVVAGRNPPPSLASASAGGAGGVEFSGFVPDISAFYASNSVTVVPMVSGGGVKIKTVEAMLSGAALVSTRIGVEGTGALADRHALVTDDAATFARHIVQLLSSPGLRARLGSAAREHATAAFSAVSWRARVAAVIEEAIGEPRRA